MVRGCLVERNLQQFIAVAETGSITAAAARLNTSQPTITVNIRKLEEKHGVALFERTARGMSLTEYGSILYESALVIERVENQMSENIHRRRQRRRQAVRIGCGHAWWPLFVRDAVKDVIAGASQASVHVETGSNLQCMWKLLSGEIMVAIGHRIDDLAPSIKADFVPLFQSVDGHFVGKSHPLAGRRCRHADLQAYPPVVSVPHDLQHGKVLVQGANNGPVDPLLDEYDMLYSSNSLVTCADMTIWSNGYTTFPMDMADKLADLGLVPVTTDSSEPPKDIGLYYLTENGDGAELQDLVRRITVAARAYEQRRPAWG